MSRRPVHIRAWALLGGVCLLSAFGCGFESTLFGEPGVTGFGGQSGLGETNAGSSSGNATSSQSTGAPSSGSSVGSAATGAGAATTGATGGTTTATGSVTSSGSSSAAAVTSVSASVASSSAMSSSAAGGGVDHAIPCGANQTCPALCCLGLLAQDCKLTAAECNAFQSVIACNDLADCDAGNVCCMTQLGFAKVAVQCAATCQGKKTRRLCATVADCGPNYASCADAGPLGLPGFFYCK